jgi:hypothetical protein
MFPLPPGGLPYASVPIDGSVRLLGAVVLVALFAAYAMLLWAIRIGRTRTVRCPVDGRTARVLFRVAGDGTRVDVDRCSLQSIPITCSKRCLATA